MSRPVRYSGVVFEAVENLEKAEAQVDWRIKLYGGKKTRYQNCIVWEKPSGNDEVFGPRSILKRRYMPAPPAHGYVTNYVDAYPE